MKEVNMNANELLNRLSKLPLRVSSVESREGITCATWPGVLSVDQFPDCTLIRKLNLVMAVVKFKDFTRLEVKALGDVAEEHFFQVCELLVRENVLSDEALGPFWEAKAQKVLEQAGCELAETRSLLDEKRALFRTSVGFLSEAGMYRSTAEKLEEAQLLVRMAGVSVEGFRPLMEEYPFLAKAQFSLWPFWLGRVPLDSKRVNIDVRLTSW